MFILCTPVYPDISEFISELPTKPSRLRTQRTDYLRMIYPFRIKVFICTDCVLCIRLLETLHASTSFYPRTK